MIRNMSQLSFSYTDNTAFCLTLQLFPLALRCCNCGQTKGQTYRANGLITDLCKGN